MYDLTKNIKTMFQDMDKPFVAASLKKQLQALEKKEDATKAKVAKEKNMFFNRLAAQIVGNIKVAKDERMEPCDNGCSSSHNKVRPRNLDINAVVGQNPSDIVVDEISTSPEVKPNLQSLFIGL